ncbi:uncharacterized protein LOC126474709 [Schistocerca serialis cubense]|uniref:uncharacterized protein LOC126474709 n=1 Tax=Schistocerca serialis cubense TaxID=2023355 RepID=UPI00214E1D11|nr:uncharacterized protein LOC126474709 [Schistocerca serialis cubense]
MLVLDSVPTVSPALPDDVKHAATPSAQEPQHSVEVVLTSPPTQASQHVDDTSVQTAQRKRLTLAEIIADNQAAESATAGGVAALLEQDVVLIEEFPTLPRTSTGEPTPATGDTATNKRRRTCDGSSSEDEAHSTPESKRQDSQERRSDTKFLKGSVLVDDISSGMTHSDFSAAVAASQGTDGRPSNQPQQQVPVDRPTCEQQVPAGVHHGVDSRDSKQTTPLAEDAEQPTAAARNTATQQECCHNTEREHKQQSVTENVNTPLHVEFDNKRVDSESTSAAGLPPEDTPRVIPAVVSGPSSAVDIPHDPPTPPSAEMAHNLVRGGFQPRLPTLLLPPGQQQQPSPLPRRQPVPLMPPAQLHPGAPRVVAPAPAVPLQSPPPSELMDVDPSAGPPSQAVAVQPVLQPLSLGTPKESDPAAPCPAPTQQPSTQRQETLPLFVGPDASSRPVPEAAPVVTGRPTTLAAASEPCPADTATEVQPAASAADHSQNAADHRDRQTDNIPDLPPASQVRFEGEKTSAPHQSRQQLTSVVPTPTKTPTVLSGSLSGKVKGSAIGVDTASVGSPTTSGKSSFKQPAARSKRAARKQSQEELDELESKLFRTQKILKKTSSEVLLPNTEGNGTSKPQEDGGSMHVDARTGEPMETTAPEIPATTTSWSEDVERD